METYVHDLLELAYVPDNEVDEFWLQDFNDFVKRNNSLTTISFSDQLDIFLEQEKYYKKYAHLLMRSKTGDLSASALYLTLELKTSDTKDQINFLQSQNEISQTEQVNSNVSSNLWPFFTFSPYYFMWEFYTATSTELIVNTLVGIACVLVLTLIFASHPSGCIFVTPIVAMIYCDVLGIAQVVGMSINPVTYMSIVLSIGLMVDYVVHVMFKYFESESRSREEKVMDCLSTMGSSIILGGSSTILSTIPLAFCTSEIFFLVFVIFLSFVVLSLAHGIILLPTVLSLCRPELEDMEEEQLEHEENRPIDNFRKETGDTAELCEEIEFFNNIENNLEE
mmetsp:Transcript_4045/g.5280  ORF Transcript_4045/g.5280 Transcript_4045/m.5280 type:complete len:337 (+) Transcript_4045:1401-2411(+)